MEIITVLLNLVGLIALLFGFLVLTAVILYLIVSALAKVTEYLPGIEEEPLVENPPPRREEKPKPVSQPPPVVEEEPPAEEDQPPLFGATSPPPKPAEAPKPPPNSKPDKNPTPPVNKNLQGNTQNPQNQPQKQQQQQSSHQPNPTDKALQAIFQKLATLGEDIKEIKALDRRIETLEEWFEQQDAELIGVGVNQVDRNALEAIADVFNLRFHDNQPLSLTACDKTLQVLMHQLGLLLLKPFFKGFNAFI